MCRDGSAVGPFDLVINNAAIGGGTNPSLRETTSTGMELRMAVNAATPHLISHLLANALTETGRIVQVGSAGQAPVDLNDLNYENAYDGIQAYCRSKLALVMSAIELATLGVHVNVVHPAHQMPTKMVLDSGLSASSTLDDGALAVLRVALDTELKDERGTYFHRFDRAQPHEQASDADVRAQVIGWLDHATGLSTS